MGMIRPNSLEEIRRRGFERVLVVATTAIGDSVLCTPLIESLRRSLPHAWLGFLVSKNVLSLYEHDRRLNSVIPYYGKYRRVHETFHRLKEDRYDLALVANANDPDVIPMIWWSGCHQIIRRPQRFTIYSFMISNPEMLSRSHTEGHAIERNLQFCDLVGVPRGPLETRLDRSEAAACRAQSMLEGYEKPYWCIHPGASRSKKQWGTGRFIQVAQKIIEREGGSLVLTGSEEDRVACDEIEKGLNQKSRVAHLCGKLSLADLAAVYERVNLLVSGDTGPYHIAMAVGTPTVTLFAPWDVGSSPSINGPYFNLSIHRVVETARMGDLISSISVEQVDRVIQEVIQETPSKRKREGND
jgi:ADP-heptose:LPS heptosyltransferase